MVDESNGGKIEEDEGGEQDGEERQEEGDVNDNDNRDEDVGKKVVGEVKGAHTHKDEGWIQRPS